MFENLGRAVSAALVLGLAAGAGHATEWKFNNGLPEGRGESAQLETFAADVAELSGGSLTIDVFHGGSLNLKDNDVARWLPRGAVEMGLVWANYLGRDGPALNAVMIQGSVGSPDELIAALPEIQEIYTEVLGELDIVPTGFMALPLLNASIFCREDPVRSLEDLKTKKLRVWSNDQVETFTKLGVSAQIVGQNEVTEAIERSPARDFGLSGEFPFVDKLLHALEQDSLLEREKAIDRIRWNYIDDLNTFQYFTLDVILGYLLKLTMLDRWRRLEPERGKAAVDNLIEELENSFVFPANFTIV